jgi:Bifunctional DNA primase/polymerase, N-terminal
VTKAIIPPAESFASETICAVLRYAAAGWPVFPCRPGTKEPATPHGFHDASTDPRRIRQWWQQWPSANVAVATGAPGPDVLDIDVKPGGDGFAAFSRLKSAGLLAGARALVQTRSGGLHVYFAGTSQACGVLRDHHLDFRGAGGYVIAPPSWVEADAKGPAGRYELVEHRPGTATLDWAACRRLLDPPRAPAPPRAGRTDVSRLVAWLERQDQPGDRHGPLHWAARRAADAGQLDAAAAAELIAASVRAGHSERDAMATVRSVRGMAR